MRISQINLEGENDELIFDKMTIIINTPHKLSESQLMTFMAYSQEMYEALLEETIDITEEGTKFTIKPIHKNLEI